MDVIDCLFWGNAGSLGLQGGRIVYRLGSMASAAVGGGG